MICEARPYKPCFLHKSRYGDGDAGKGKKHMGLLERPITTQEDLDALIGERLKRDREAQAKKYEGWLSPVQQAEAAKESKKQIEDLTKQLENQAKGHADTEKQLLTLQAQNHKYETDSVKRRVAHEVGLDWGFADRLTGETEEDIRRDAESLKSLVGATSAPPLKTYEADKGTQTTEAAWKNVLSQLKGE